ncbi:hypothetical protein DFJ77DRAFT_510124 [Powellomyces hirtus]|nr:hypothetical protein DFJ77DRAFT_510124 [Powellomyces hirtus]
MSGTKNTPYETDYGKRIECRYFSNNELYKWIDKDHQNRRIAVWERDLDGVETYTKYDAAGVQTVTKTDKDGNETVSIIQPKAGVGSAVLTTDKPEAKENKDQPLTANQPVKRKRAAPDSNAKALPMATQKENQPDVPKGKQINEKGKKAPAAPKAIVQQVPQKGNKPKGKQINEKGKKASAAPKATVHQIPQKQNEPNVSTVLEPAAAGDANDHEDDDEGDDSSQYHMALDVLPADEAADANQQSEKPTIVTVCVPNNVNCDPEDEEERYYWEFPVDNVKMHTAMEKVEWANEAKVDMLINCTYTDSNLKKKLKLFRKCNVAVNQYRIEYTYSKYSINESGRLFARNGVGLQAFPRDVRAFIAKEFYVDVDFVNSMPTQLSQVFHQENIKCDKLDEYVENRPKVLKEQRLTKKGAIALMLNSGSVPTNEFFAGIHSAIYKRLVPLWQSDNPYYKSLWDHIRTIRHNDIKGNKEGSFVSLVMQTFENRALLPMISELHKMGYELDVPIFDGGLVPETNFDMKIVEKPMTVSAEFYKKHRLSELLAAKEDVESSDEDDTDGEEEEVPLTTEEAAIARASNSMTHVDFAKLTNVICNGVFVFDAKQFWMFDKKWHPTVNQRVRSYIDQTITPIFTSKFDEIVANLESIEKKMTNAQKTKKCEAITDMYEVWAEKKRGMEKFIRMLGTNSQINALVECFQTEVLDEKFLEKLDTDPFKIGANNCYIDIRTGKTHSYTKDVLITKSVGYDYFLDDSEKDLKLKAEWLEFVEQLFPIEEERHIVHIYMGYCLRGDHPEKIFAMFMDKSGGYCGKSKFAEAFMKALGTYAIKGVNTHIYANTGFSNQNGHNSAQFATEGRRLAIFEELDEKKDLDNKKAKDVHGGNASGNGRRPHSKVDEHIDFITKWILIFNDLCQPKFDTGDIALVTRILVICFRAKFFPTMEEFNASNHPYKHLMDPHVGEKFPAWAPYIMEWALEGYQHYMKEGFRNIPASCKEWKKDVSAAVDNLVDFIDEHLVETGDEDNVLELKAIKERMSPSMKNRFKSKDHLIDRLSACLGRHYIDTGKGDTRKTDFWRGWQLSERSSRFF